MVACIGLSSHDLAASGLAGEVKLVHISTDYDDEEQKAYFLRKKKTNFALVDDEIVL